MKLPVIGGIVLTAVLLTCVVLGFGRYRQAFPPASAEIVELSPEKRTVLERLRAEAKFGPHAYPPLGYTGAATPQDRDVASRAVDDMIEGVLAHRDGPIGAKETSRLIAKALRRLDLLETEDRERAGGCMLEVWYILGFKGATGVFAHGSAFPRWPG